jgi:hypothetical protein
LDFPAVIKYVAQSLAKMTWKKLWLYAKHPQFLLASCWSCIADLISCQMALHHHPNSVLEALAILPYAMLLWMSVMGVFEAG